MSAAPAIISSDALSLPALIDRAVKALASARSAAEVLEARAIADIAYDMARKAVRLVKAKQAHDDLISAALRAEGDAMKIRSEAAHRLADEYDAAQERGEVGQQTGRPKVVPDQNDISPPSAADLGLSRKEIHEARIIRDAERASPGIVGSPGAARKILYQLLVDHMNSGRRTQRLVSR